jgi:hypothetical protein
MLDCTENTPSFKRVLSKEFAFKARQQLKGYQDGMSLKSNYHSPVTWLSRRSYERAYGIAPDAQIDIERAYRTFLNSPPSEWTFLIRKQQDASFLHMGQQWNRMREGLAPYGSNVTVDIN